MMTDYAEMRRLMVASQLRTTGVSDPHVVAAMGAVAREAFVPADRTSLAYADAAVPLGEGRWLMPPMPLGRLLSEARPRPGERALVVAAGTGYAAAVLSRLVDEVVAVEAAGPLVEKARAALPAYGVEVVEGEFAAGHPAGAPYDLILIDGAVEEVPEALVDQLAGEGRLVTGLARDGVTRLAIGRRGGAGFGLVAFADAAVPVLPGAVRPKAFSF